MKEIIGQIFGIIAVIITFVSLQAKTRKSVLLIQTIATGCIIINYALLGATSGFVLNIINFVRNTVYFFNDKKFLSSPLIPYAFAVISVIFGALSWEGYYSIFLIVGLAINTVFISKEPQALRKSILLTSTLILIYNIYVFSIGGILNETVALTSSVIGIIRFRQQKNKI